jgi:putative transcriptional regulator
MNSPKTPFYKTSRTAASHAPMRQALQRKRRRLTICLLLALAVLFIYPGLRDRLNARDYLQRLAPGKVLVATPKLYGQMFRDTELLIVQHDEEGTQALVLGVPFSEGLERMRQIQSPQRKVLIDAAQPADFWGGPLKLNKPLTLSANQLVSSDSGTNPLSEDSIAVGDYTLQVHQTSTLDSAIEATSAVTFRGYAGWLPGQLARELRDGRWQVLNASAPVLERHLAQLFNTIAPKEKVYGH